MDISEHESHQLLVERNAIQVSEHSTGSSAPLDERQSSTSRSSDAEKTNNLEEGVPYTCSQVTEALGFGKAQILPLLALCVGCFCETSEMASLPILSTRLYVEFDLTPELESALGSASYAGFAISYLFWGFVCDKIGRKRGLLLAYLWSLTWSLLCCVAPNITWLVAFRLIFSFSGGSTNLIMPYFYEYLPSKHRYVGFISGNLIATQVLGTSFPPIAAMIIFRNDDYGTWRYYILACSMPILIFLIAAILFLDESPRYLIKKGHIERAGKIFRKIGRLNKKHVPHNLVLADDLELGSTEQDNRSVVKDILQALKNWNISRNLICMTLIGAATRYVAYGMSFVKTEVIFEQGQSDGYCDGGLERSYYLDTQDYLNLLWTTLPYSVSVLTSLVMFKMNISLKATGVTCFSATIALLSCLYMCPKLSVALFIVTLTKILCNVVTTKNWASLSGVSPTGVRTSLFGLSCFLMYLPLPAYPYLIQVFSKQSQHYVTAISSGIIFVGLVGAWLLPRAVYEN